MQRDGHPASCKDDDCTLTYREHLLGIGVLAAAMPSRKRSIIGTNHKESVLSRDLDAYSRLRSDGLQPPKIDGAHALEAKATCADAVNTGKPEVSERAFRVFRDEFGHSAAEVAR